MVTLPLFKPMNSRTPVGHRHPMRISVPKRNVYTEWRERGFLSNYKPIVPATCLTVKGLLSEQCAVLESSRWRCWKEEISIELFRRKTREVRYKLPRFSVSIWSPEQRSRGWEKEMSGKSFRVTQVRAGKHGVKLASLLTPP